MLEALSISNTNFWQWGNFCSTKKINHHIQHQENQIILGKNIKYLKEVLLSSLATLLKGR